MRTEFCHEDVRPARSRGRARGLRGWPRRLIVRTARRRPPAQDDLWDYLLRWLAVLDELVEVRTEELRQLILLRARMRSQFAELGPHDGVPSKTPADGDAITPARG